jgi:hypothetical protein
LRKKFLLFSSLIRINDEKQKIYPIGVMTMYIETTYMMTDEVMDLLAEAEEITGYDQIELVSLCMQMMRENHKEYLEKQGRIKYQDRLDEETGLPIPKHRVHVTIPETHYDYFQDSRKFFRRSISLCFAICVLKYLAIIIAHILAEKNDKDQHNYPHRNYALIEKCKENITVFEIWWGVPENLEALFS